MKSDIYSFGIILFELITAIHPHKNLMEYINLVSLFLFIATSSVSNNDNGGWIVSLYVQYCIEICNMYRTFKVCTYSQNVPQMLSSFLALSPGL